MSVFTDAIDYLRVHGWSGPQPGIRKGGPGCIMQALAWSQPDSEEDGGTWYDAVELLGQHTPQGRLSTWNDTPGRTREEVYALLRWGDEQA